MIFQIEQRFIWNKTGNLINFHFQENRFLYRNRSKVFTRISGPENSLEIFNDKILVPFRYC